MNQSDPREVQQTSEIKQSELPGQNSQSQLLKRKVLVSWMLEALLCVAAFGIIAPFLPSVMRESDQASVVFGALKIAHGAGFTSPDFYHFDKMYGSYFVLALLYKLVPQLNPVTIANVFQFGLWCITSFALVAQARRRSWMARVLLGVTLFSPIWILNVPFFSPAAISAYTLVALFCVPAFGVGGAVVAFFLAFIATAFRADAVLLIPFLIWARGPRCSFKVMLLRPFSIALTGGTGMALLLGPIFARGGISPMATPIRILPKVIAAFTLFGMGSAVLIYAMIIIALATAALRRRWRWYYLAGLAAFCLPFTYYVVQLLSPRYLLLTVTISACAVCNRRLLMMLRELRVARRFVFMLPVCAVLPLIVGLSLPTAGNPRLTFSNPTTYPTADGHWPMGALAGFAWRSRTADGVRIDHNQAIFASVLTADFEYRCSGLVPVLHTPMTSFFELGLALRGIPTRIVPHIHAGDCEYAYADLRSLTHKWLHPFEPDESPDILPALELVSGSDSQQPLVLVGKEHNPVLRLELTEVRKTLGGREFQLVSAPNILIDVRTGLDYVLVAPDRFNAASICFHQRSLLAVSSTGNGLYEARFKTNNIGCVIEITGSDVLVSRKVLPDYMR